MGLTFLKYSCESGWIHERKAVDALVAVGLDHARLSPKPVMISR